MGLKMSVAITTQKKGKSWQGLASTHLSRAFQDT
uniref:Uncharacterized protein n=1 Tax=Rhizophora mucronata TaxID=61149 RepID=A0A2P2R060_RHIMU